MSNKFKDIDIYIDKPHILLFNDIINIKNFDPNKIKTDEKPYKNICIYYIGYVTIEDMKYLKIVHTLLFKK